MNRSWNAKGLFFGLAAVIMVAPGLFGKVTPVKAATPCIVTLFGQQYDVTSLQSNHPGGNIFTCGTDMTAVYQAQHGTDMSRMQMYLVTAPTPTVTPIPTVSPSVTPAPTVSPTPSPNDEEGEYEDEDEDDVDEGEDEMGEDGQSQGQGSDKRVAHHQSIFEKWLSEKGQSALHTIKAKEKMLQNIFFLKGLI